MATNIQDPKRTKYCCFCKSWISKGGDAIISCEKNGIKFDTNVYGDCLKKHGTRYSGNSGHTCKDWSPNVDAQRYL